MKNYYDKTWKIGELAKIFDVNVQLLRHYDKEGLLVPDIRNPENKWRAYRYDQIYTLGMIRFLRYLDCSLEEIGDFMPGRNAQNTETFLNEKIVQTRKKYEKILIMEAAVRDRFERIRSEMPYAEADQTYVISEEQIDYIETAGLEDIFADELFYMYPTLVLYEGDNVTFASRIRPEDAGAYKEKICTIPPSDYLVGFHRGAYENIYDTFEKIRQTAGGLLDEDDEISGQILTINIIDQLVEENRDNFITKVMMRIRHKDGGAL